MHKIASPQDLQAELRRLLAYSEEVQPSRQVLASELRTLADRVAAGNFLQEEASDKIEDLIAHSRAQIATMQSLTSVCKGKGTPELATSLKYAMKYLVDADRTFRSIKPLLERTEF